MIHIQAQKDLVTDELLITIRVTKQHIMCGYSTERSRRIAEMMDMDQFFGHSDLGMEKQTGDTDMTYSAHINSKTINSFASLADAEKAITKAEKKAPSTAFLNILAIAKAKYGYEAAA